jgi:hypothetical protein
MMEIVQPKLAMKFYKYGAKTTFLLTNYTSPEMGKYTTHINRNPSKFALSCSRFGVATRQLGIFSGSRERAKTVSTFSTESPQSGR